MRWLLVPLLLAAPAAAAQPASRFDGTWDVTLACPEVGAARAYTLRFPAQVRAGRLSGSHETQADGRLQVEGPIQPDGTAMLAASGTVGRAENALNRAAAGAAYAYRIEARFTDRQGTGRRLGQRPFEVTFTRR